MSNSWDEKWKKESVDGTSSVPSVTYPLGIVSKIGYDIAKNNIKNVIKSTNLEKSSKIIDVGCGEGRTLDYFRELGFEHLKGIDISKSALKLCEKRGFVSGRNVFLMNATSTKFKNREFDLVFSEGLLEHFKDFNPLVKEISRISNKYIMLVQPNHHSPTGRMLNLFMENFSKSHEREYDYKINDFIKAFSKKGFENIAIKPTHLCLTFLDTSCIIMFKRKDS